jgi:hypothetical protein
VVSFGVTQPFAHDAEAEPLVGGGETGVAGGVGETGTCVGDAAEPGGESEPPVGVGVVPVPVPVSVVGSVPPQAARTTASDTTIGMGLRTSGLRDAPRGGDEDTRRLVGEGWSLDASVPTRLPREPDGR